MEHTSSLHVSLLVEHLFYKSVRPFGRERTHKRGRIRSIVSSPNDESACRAKHPADVTSIPGTFTWGMISHRR
jgi:hypothetical protein